MTKTTYSAVADVGPDPGTTSLANSYFDSKTKFGTDLSKASSLTNK